MVRPYPIDESLVSLAVKASGDRPVEQVLSDALTEYTHRRLPSAHPPLTPDRHQAIQQWLAEGTSIPLADPPPSPPPQHPSSDLLPILTEKYRRQGLVL